MLMSHGDLLVFVCTALFFGVGLGPTVAQYVPALRARGLDGPKLLMLRCDDLEYLGMHIIGHQELLLEAVEHLRNFVSVPSISRLIMPLVYSIYSL